ncbi:PTS sugar transporter subunit IIA [Actinomycetes bacterium M1A6_2h]
MFINPDAPDRAALLTFLADQAHSLGYVTEKYADALIAREVKFPTGLPSRTPAAIPHADAPLVNKSGIGVALLPNPVTFEEMGSPGRTVDVRLVLLLLVTDPSTQATILASVIKMIQSEDLIERLLALDDRHAVADAVQALLR